MAAVDLIRACGTLGAVCVSYYLVYVVKRHRTIEACPLVLAFTAVDDEGCLVSHHHSPLKMSRNALHIITLIMIAVPLSMNSAQMMKIS